MTKEQAFSMCTIVSGESINCKLGLWGVTCADKESRYREARHYFMQYMRDGEYWNIIGGMSPAGILAHGLKGQDFKFYNSP